MVSIVAAMAIGAAAHARADESDLVLSDAWIRTIVPERPAAGYFTLKNNGDRPRTLTGALSEACGSIMLHQSRTENGIDRMVMTKEVAVPAHGTLTFAPRGYHLMCMSPSPDLKPGGEASVTLQFSDGATLSAPFEVHGAAGR